jgi:hypothetical protein
MMSLRNPVTIKAKPTFADDGAGDFGQSKAS